MPSSPPLRVSRRSTLGGLLLALTPGALLLSAGCERNQPPGSVGAPTDGPDPAAATGRGAEEPDAALRDRAVSATAAAQSLLAATSQRHPGLSGALTGLQQMHAAHHDLLVASSDLPGDDAGVADLPPRVPRGSRRALRAVRRHEVRCGRDLAALALEARSGGLARILASMAAAVGQQVTGLPRTSGSGPA